MTEEIILNRVDCPLCDSLNIILDHCRLPLQPDSSIMICQALCFDCGVAFAWRIAKQVEETK